MWFFETERSVDGKVADSMTSSVSRSRLLMPSLLTALLLELPVGGLWLYPLLLMSWRLGGKWAAQGVVLVWLLRLALAFLLGGAVSSALWSELVLLSVLTMVGVVFGALTLRGRSLTQAGLVSVGSLVLLSTGLVIAGLVLSPEQVMDRLRTEFVLPMQQALDEVARTGENDLETMAELDSIRKFLGEQSRWVFYLLPSLLGSSMLMTLWLNVWLVKAMEPVFGGLRPLREWRAPEVLIWAVIGAAVLILTGIEPLVAVGLNILLLGATVYLLAGLAVMGYGAFRWRIPQWLLLMVCVGMFFTGTLPVLSLVGLLDFQLDFRKRWQRSDEERE